MSETFASVSKFKSVNLPEKSEFYRENENLSRTL